MDRIGAAEVSARSKIQYGSAFQAVKFWMIKIINRLLKWMLLLSIRFFIMASWRRGPGGTGRPAIFLVNFDK